MATSDPDVPRLVVTGPEEHEGLVFNLSQPELVIGHSDTADIVLDDPYLSRRHALISIDNGVVTVHDLKSTGGTFVNDERLAGPRVLRPGDVVQFADLFLRFESGSSSDVPMAEEAVTQSLSVYPGTDAPQDADTPAPQDADTDAPQDADTPAPQDADTDAPQDADTDAPQDADTDAPQDADTDAPQDADTDAPQDADTDAPQDADTDAPQDVDAESTATPPADREPVPEADAPVAASASPAATPPASAPGRPSEYESLTAALAALYPGRPGTLPDEAGQQDITDGAGEAGWDAHAVALAVLADQFGQITVAAPVGSSEPAQPQAQAATVSLRPEFYYALFRAGLPANGNGLTQASPALVRAIWRQASTHGVIPQALAGDVPGAVASLQAISAAHALGAVPPVDISMLREMLQATIPEAAQQERLTQLCAEYGGDGASFWPAAEEALGAGPVQQLQLMSQLLHLTAGNQPLVAALLAAEPDSPLASAMDLAAHGYYDAAKWVPVIGAAIPPGIPGADAGEQASNYAQLLAAQVGIAFPTAVLADQVRRNVLPIADTPGVATAVANFLTSDQGRFEIGVEPVEAYIARTGLTGTPAGVITQVKRLQQAYQLTHDDASLAVLLRHNLGSALAVARYDPAGFVRAFAGELGGAATASAIHAWAGQVFAFAGCRAGLRPCTSRHDAPVKKQWPCSVPRWRAGGRTRCPRRGDPLPRGQAGRSSARPGRTWGRCSGGG